MLNRIYLTWRTGSHLNIGTSHMFTMQRLSHIHSPYSVTFHLCNSIPRFATMTLSFCTQTQQTNFLCYIIKIKYLIFLVLKPYHIDIPIFPFFLLPCCPHSFKVFQMSLLLLLHISWFPHYITNHKFVLHVLLDGNSQSSPISSFWVLVLEVLTSGKEITKTKEI